MAERRPVHVSFCDLWSEEWVDRRACGKKELGVMDDISFRWFYTFVGGRNFLFLFMLSLLNLGAFCWDSIVGVEKGGFFLPPPYIFILVFWFLES